MTFSLILHLSANRRNPSTSFKVRKSPLRLDVLTPAKSQKEEYQPVPVPKFKTAAQALKYLDYFIENPHPAAIISASGILVNIPDPARYAYHKLISRPRLLRPCLILMGSWGGDMAAQGRIPTRCTVEPLAPL
jgi:hypothetical protein